MSASLFLIIEKTACSPERRGAAGMALFTSKCGHEPIINHAFVFCENSLDGVNRIRGPTSICHHIWWWRWWASVQKWKKICFSFWYTRTHDRCGMCNIVELIANFDSVRRLCPRQTLIKHQTDFIIIYCAFRILQILIRYDLILLFSKCISVTSISALLLHKSINFG